MEVVLHCGEGSQPDESIGAGQYQEPPQQLLSLLEQGLPQAPLKGRVGTPLSLALHKLQ